LRYPELGTHSGRYHSRSPTLQGDGLFELLVQDVSASF
jgi:hypothetical protein